jgi:hypothetical protein
MNYISSDIVGDYILNEIDYIKQDMENEYMNKEDLQQDLKYLKDLSDSDVKDITEKVNNDSELENKITELIHYWVYHK